MPFEKGQSGNPNGRPKGTPNRVAKDLRERIKELLESRFDQVSAAFDTLEAKDMLTVYVKLLEFNLPKLQRSETVVDVSSLKDDEVNRMFDLALTKMESAE